MSSRKRAGEGGLDARDGLVALGLGLVRQTRETCVLAGAASVVIGDRAPRDAVRERADAAGLLLARGDRDEHFLHEVVDVGRARAPDDEAADLVAQRVPCRRVDHVQQLGPQQDFVAPGLVARIDAEAT